MTSALYQLLTVILLLSFHTLSSAATDTEVCKALSGLLSEKRLKAQTNPARAPTKSEMAFINREKLEILEYNDYSQGVYIVDADNDGTEDYFVWNIQGSGRFGMAEIYSRLRVADEKGKSFLKKWEQSVGILVDPKFVRYTNVNYLVITEDGSSEGLSVRQIEKLKTGNLATRSVCQANIVLDTLSQCRHPACKKLIGQVNDSESNGAFINIEWPHKYFAPAGLQIFFPRESIEVDFDNTKRPTKIWRFGREGYIYQNISWSLLGVGESEPRVASSLRNKDDSINQRSVLPSNEHDRLRRLMSQHSDVLSKEVGKKVSLPTDGDFFHIDINDRVYWVWELGGQPYGNNMHILYTRGNKSDYIGKVSIKRKVELKPCDSACTTKD